MGHQMNQMNPYMMPFGGGMPFGLGGLQQALFPYMQAQAQLSAAQGPSFSTAVTPAAASLARPTAVEFHDMTAGGKTEEVVEEPPQERPSSPESAPSNSDASNDDTSKDEGSDDRAFVSVQKKRSLE